MTPAAPLRPTLAAPSSAATQIQAGHSCGSIKATTSAPPPKSTPRSLRGLRPPAPGATAPAVVQIALSTGDRGLAGRRSEQLTRLADEYGSVALRARAEAACGVVALAQGNATSAVGSLREAVKHWRHAGAPHQVATTRVALAGALDASGDDAAGDELDQALLAFERLGAVGDHERTASLLGRPTARRRVVRTFMFTDIEDSTSLLAAMGDDAWSDVLDAHDRLLRDCFVDTGGQEIKQRGGGDGFFVVFDTPSSAARCAVQMQQRLDTQRRELGFAPHVRVGFHEAEALMAALRLLGAWSARDRSNRGSRRGRRDHRECHGR